MWRGIASLAAKLARNARRRRLKLPKQKGAVTLSDIYGDEKRLHEALEFMRGFAKKQDFSNLPATKATLQQVIKNPQKYQPVGATVPMRSVIAKGKGKVKNLFRGETLHPDPFFKSKTGAETGIDAGRWWTIEPFEAANYAIRPSKIKGGWGAVNPIKPGQPWPLAMGEGITNPGVIRRMKINKDISELEGMRNTGTGWSHFHPTDKMIGESKISMFYSVINRLREMGWKDAQIFKYMGQIMKKKNPAGKSDWMLYNRGGMV